MSELIPAGQLYPHSIPPGTLKPGAAKRNTTAASAPAVRTAANSFEHILQDRLIHFSRHAEVRLQQRGIHLKPEHLSRLQTAIDQAAAKGSKDSLILFKDMALIVNVPNRTVVTAMDGKSMQDNVFTQIDSAVVVSS